LVIPEYKKTLELDPSHQEALKGLAYFLYQGYRHLEAETYYRRALALHPDDPEALGALAAIDYGLSASDLVQTRIRLNISPKAPLFQLPSCPDVRDRIQTRVQEGLAFATRAQLLVNNNSDLIGFLSILIFLTS